MLFFQTASLSASRVAPTRRASLQAEAAEEEKTRIAVSEASLETGQMRLGWLLRPWVRSCVCEKVRSALL